MTATLSPSSPSISFQVASVTIQGSNQEEILQSISKHGLKRSVGASKTFKYPAVCYPLLSEIEALGLSGNLVRLLTVLCENVTVFNLCVQERDLLVKRYDRSASALRRNLRELEQLGYVKVHMLSTKHDPRYIIQIAPWYVWRGGRSARDVEIHRWMMEKCKSPFRGV